MKFSIRTPILTHLPDTYHSVACILWGAIAKSQTGCISFDGFRAALDSLIAAGTWKFVSSQRKIQNVPITALDLGDVSI